MGQTYEKGSADAVVQKQKTAACMILDLSVSRQVNLFRPFFERWNLRFVPTHNPKNRSHLKRPSSPV